ncbi:ABC transporter permease [Streptomyces chartreusis]|uniref:ABC transporter permease n=1 Tax=Streptomyces chartreusis TaxID=1969 RepID=A0A7H8T445_STRCX|nr:MULTISPECIES: ABC transporter permease [Streptomyces]MBT1090998.1 ABC transporter permease [Streptomyces sp. Tu102]QEV66830.1 ABC transporter permease [Streptomyces chartreusis]QKZ17812.1 ABC transporter permease [Streptomyces chartreusis]RSO05715.1 ABC transporter permease [Streptomyces sp. WAC 05379]GGX03776.1 peptide ABC transporter substrate-binding protein [Streptomyces chartreusis]
MTAVSADVLLPARRRRGRRRPVLVLAGAAFLALVVLAAGFAPLLAPYAPDAVDLSASLVGTSGDHLLGTDASGQDLLSRVLYGARTSLIAPLALLAIAALLGVTLGTVAAWRGGWTDTLVSRVTDVMYAFPGLLFVVLIIAVFGAGITTSVLGLGLAFAPTIAKYTRSVALAERAKPYVDAYRVQGMSGSRICVRHLVPNLARSIVGYLVVLFGEALMSLATLSYLGFGSQPPSSDWGLMVQEGQAAIVQGALLPALVPGTAIAAVVVAFNVVGVWAADRLGARR